ncbi:hypothetical protein Lsha_0981 [Legionella shakespearei DSM 23087]|uniref:Uncharacterized protein n=1 Tax=Legionella shakespearei DSM 23087 TaxID=1122169 RepID=A0A0W0Z0H2_9GAMM|nr:hypothetical protein Lsha_0981 [Legionella shakespearei DSM 23087]
MRGALRVGTPSRSIHQGKNLCQCFRPPQHERIVHAQEVPLLFKFDVKYVYWHYKNVK